MSSSATIMDSTPSTAKQPIHQLPISPSAPIYHLPPDPLTPTPASLLAFSAYTPPSHLSGSSGGPLQLREGDPVPPSMLRRSRMIREGGAFSFVSPLPLEFPYDITDPEVTQGSVKEVGEERQARPTSIEASLAEFEPSLQHPVGLKGIEPNDKKATAFTSSRRLASSFPNPKLLSFSRRCHDEWLPQLDAGDAAKVVLEGPGTTEEVAKRELLVDVLGGKTVLARVGEGEEEGFAPWSLCYGGHQFGSWASQLGDGRAISILSTPATPEVASATGFTSLELQLKGAGRTPYSRFADGLAVLRSSIREYLGAEAMAALKLPTSRALALVGLKDVRIRRETMETGAIVTRVAPSWIRIGNFEIQWSRKEWETLRLLKTFVANEVLKIAPEKGEARTNSEALAVVYEVARRNAVMIAGWQAYGFMHGVMNTDNIAVTGQCIDYGPYAMMDVFDTGHICNHSDEMGRYSYRNQPTMGLFAIHKLGDSLAELIGHELSLADAASTGTGFAQAQEGWASNEEELKTWRQAGVEEVKKVDSVFQEVLVAEYTRLFRLRLGLLTDDSGDHGLVSYLLNLLEQYELDYSRSIRLLSQLPRTDSPSLQSFISLLLPDVSAEDLGKATTDWMAWFSQYEARLAQPAEVEASTREETSRRERMNSVNPRFVLRQWVLEETIKKVDQEEDLIALDRVLEMASEPFKAYGEVQVGSDNEVCEVVGGEERERQRLCEIGDSGMLGFQCSCSS